MPSIAPDSFFDDPSKPVLHVAAAVIEGNDDQILISKRADHLHQGGRWEFPGGKLEDDEAVEEALKRELLEELAICVTTCHPLIKIPYSYPEHHVLLDVWRVTAFDGLPHGNEGQKIQWVNRQNLKQYQFPPANNPIIKAAQLPDKLYITPEPGEPSDWDSFLEQVDVVSQSGAKLLLLRSKQLDSKTYLELARLVMDIVLLDDCKVMLNSCWQDVMKCNAAGLHITFDKLPMSVKDPHRQDYLLSTSCHSEQQLANAERMDIDFTMLSPVKKTLTHPDAIPLGWESFAEMANGVSIPVYALGGMSENDLIDAWNHGAQGVAAIRALWED